jgi:hypothetical protein
MSLGRTPTQQIILSSTETFCRDQLADASIYRYLHDNSAKLFPDESFADLFEKLGRDSVPPRIVAVVMVLQRLEGLSDREAVQRFTYDIRWKYAAGGLAFDYPGFTHTVLVRMRMRLRDSEWPNRIFEVVLDVAKAGGVVGRKRVLDSTPIYDAVATQDTVTLIRSAIRGLLQKADRQLAVEIRGVLARDDDYVAAGKPVCDWTDAEARDELIDALCKDARAVLSALHGRELSESVRQAAELLATVVDQDTEVGDDGRFRIVQKVAKHRVLSTVDPEARHGHKSKSRKFDGYKGHISIDPDSEIITATVVTPGNASDASAARELVKDVLGAQTPAGDARENPGKPHSSDDEPGTTEVSDESVEASGQYSSTGEVCKCEPIEIYGDAAYGDTGLIEECKKSGIEPYLKVQPPSAKKGQFSKDDFAIDLQRGTVTCPAGKTVLIRLRKDGSGKARFGAACRQCSLFECCTCSHRGRLVQIHTKEQILQEERQKQKNQPEWRERYRSTRPKVERKIGHAKRRYHGGRRARMRGRKRIGDDFALLAASLNLQRLAKLGIHPGVPKTTRSDQERTSSDMSIHPMSAAQMG